MKKWIYVVLLSMSIVFFGCQSGGVDTTNESDFDDRVNEVSGEGQINNNEEGEIDEVEENYDGNKNANVDNEEDLEGTELPDDVEEAAGIIAFETFKYSDSKPEDVVTGLEYVDNVLSITVVGKEGWSEKSMGMGFYEDSTTVYKKLSEYDELEEVWLYITFPMVDTYGNEEVAEVMTTWMSRNTLDKINWDNFYYGDLLDVVDGMSVLPQFVQD